jgi:hypothetical protein
LEARPCPFSARQNTALRLSAFRFRIFVFFFFSFFPVRPSFVMPGLDPGIHAEVTLTKRFHRRSGRGASAWTTGSSPVVTISESRVTVAWHSSGAKARRENGECWMTRTTLCAETVSMQNSLRMVGYRL